ncbi:hypothetical protein ACFL35_11645 [Candidatus Riflebacteria bacterium]
MAIISRYRTIFSFLKNRSVARYSCLRLAMLFFISLFYPVLIHAEEKKPAKEELVRVEKLITIYKKDKSKKKNQEKGKFSLENFKPEKLKKVFTIYVKDKDGKTVPLHVSEGEWVTRGGEPFIWFVQVNENPVAFTREQYKHLITKGRLRGFVNPLKAKIRNPFGANPDWAKATQVTSGVSAGKFYAKAGFSNARHYLKSGFSGQGLLAIAGIVTVMELGRQIKSEEDINFRKVGRILTSGNFIGGVTGAAMGGATGSFIAPALTMVPVIGGALAAVAPAFGTFAGSMFGSAVGQRKTIREAFKGMKWWEVAGQGVGGVLGATIGSALIPPIGTLAGGIVGSIIGNRVARWLENRLNRGVEIGDYVVVIGKEDNEGIDEIDLKEQQNPENIPIGYEKSKPESKINPVKKEIPGEEQKPGKPIQPK